MVLDQGNDTADKLGFWPTMATRVIPILLTGIVTTLIYGSIQLAKMDSRLGETERSILRIDRWNAEQDKRMSDFDIAGSRQIPTLDRRISILENTVNSRSDIIDKYFSGQAQLPPQAQVEFEAIKRNMARIEDQQRRIIEALDHTYSLINEHLSGKPQPKPRLPPKEKNQ